MEEIEELFKDFKYIAVFDPNFYHIIKVGPEYAFQDEKNKIVIEDDIALGILEGKISMTNFCVDIDDDSLILIEKLHTNKIDNVLHRIVEKKWSKEKELEIFITYSKKNKSLKFELTSTYSGTKKNKYTSKKKVRWSDETRMDFYVTEYNDPHELIRIVSFPLNQLINRFFLITDLELPKKFSIYTRRIFHGYVLEIK